MDASITINQLLQIVAAGVAMWGGYKVILEIVGRINTKHDQVQKWDEYDKQIKSIKNEQGILTKCMFATLDGLGQLGANGEVTKTRNMLEAHLNDQAHN